MDEQTQKKIIEDQMKTLPKDVVGAISSVDYKTKLQEITRRQKLLIDQAGKLEMETTLVMIGLEPLDDYVSNLQREINISLIHAKEIAIDVSENIFKPIRQSLKDINQQFKESDEVNNLALDNPEENKEQEDIKFTNTNEVNLNRDQILSEIENPSSINNKNTNFTPPPPVIKTETKVIETRPVLEIETIPGQEAIDVKNDILKAKMSGPTVTTQQVVNIKPEIKLPEKEEKVPPKNIDPYREPLV